MSQAPQKPVREHLDPREGCLRYFRLNDFCRSKTSSFIQKDAVVSARTPISLRCFPYRAERLFDNPNDIVADDEHLLALSRELTELRK